jgi:hypothetical protein
VLLSGAGDTTAPGTYVQFSGTLGNHDIYTSPVTLTFTGHDPDDASNTLTTYVTVNGGPVAAENSLTLTNDGAYTVDYWSVDPAGNREETEHQYIRIDTTPPSVSAYANPDILWPPNHKFVPVTVTGHVNDNFSGIVHTVSYHVADEYHQVQPSGVATVNSQGNYSFVVNLQSSRLGQDRNGRQYTIYVTAYDVAGNTATASPGVLVPHDMGHGFPRGQTGPVVSIPTQPNRAELQRERLAAREHAIELRREQAQANLAQRNALQHARQLQHQLAHQHPLQAIGTGHGQNPHSVTLPNVAANHGNGPQVSHGNGNGNGHGPGQSHGNSGNHGHGKG